ncbi:MAG: DUF2780 domain-containing protein [Gammaproteobacteria bacterium]|nr:DUF2780 domain-containing protein [Gammaproteobacteria bacterium]
MINDFIQMAVSNLDLSEDTARSATGGLLQMIQDKVGGDEASQLMEQLPGSQELMSIASDGNSGGGLGGLVSQVGSMLGGNLGSAAGLLGMLGDAGLSADKLGPFASLFVGFLKDRIDSGVVDQIMEKLPELQELLG